MKALRNSFSAVAAFAAVLTVLAFTPEFLYAQSRIIDTGGLANEVKYLLRPIIGLVRWLIIVGGIVAGFWEAFKASRGGQAKGWLTAILLWVVAAIAFAPSVFFGLLGLDIDPGEYGWGD